MLSLFRFSQNAVMMMTMMMVMMVMAVDVGIFLGNGIKLDKRTHICESLTKEKKVLTTK